MKDLTVGYLKDLIMLKETNYRNKDLNKRDWLNFQELDTLIIDETDKFCIP